VTHDPNRVRNAESVIYHGQLQRWKAHLIAADVLSADDMWREAARVLGHDQSAAPGAVSEEFAAQITAGVDAWSAGEMPHPGWSSTRLLGYAEAAWRARKNIVAPAPIMPHNANDGKGQ
jgi:hypothetical protein